MDTLSFDQQFTLSVLSEATGLFRVKIVVMNNIEIMDGYRVVCYAHRRSGGLYSAVAVLKTGVREYFLDKSIPNGIYDFHLLTNKDQEIGEGVSKSHFIVGQEIDIKASFEGENILVEFEEPIEKGVQLGIFEIEQTESKERFLIGLKAFEEVGECVLQRLIPVENKFQKGRKYEIRVFFTKLST
ncbi:Uncharacterized protein QTN25_004403 [Entamoeba marina]